VTSADAKPVQPVQPGRPAARPLAVGLAVALAVAAVVLAGLHLLDQHRRYGSWQWSSASPTSRLPFRDRDYLRANTRDAPPRADVRLGTTWDGLPILGPPFGANAPTGVEVQVSPTEYVYYSLVGGP
jgi:hypothetical protein